MFVRVHHELYSCIRQSKKRNAKRKKLRTVTRQNRERTTKNKMIDESDRVNVQESA